MIPGLDPGNPWAGAALAQRETACASALTGARVGGAPLLGVNGVVVIGHGRSDVKAIRSMIRMAEKSAQQKPRPG